MKKSFLILVLAVSFAAFNPAQSVAQIGAQAAAQTGTQTAAQTGAQTAAQTGAQAAAQTGTQTAVLSIRDVPYVDLYSNASREVTPDEIYLKICLDEEPAKGKFKLADQQREVVKVLKALEIPVENLTVYDMESDLHRYILKKNQTYAKKVLLLKVGSAEQMANVLERLNALNIPDVEFSGSKVSDKLQQQVKEELMVEATQKAKRSATILAENVGAHLGRPLMVENTFSYSPRNGVLRTKAFAPAGYLLNSAEDSVYQEESVEIAKSQISVNIHFRFELK